MNTAEKTNVLKPRVFETAAFIASIEPGKSMSACAMNTFKTVFFSSGQGCKYLVLHFCSYQSQKSFNPNTDH